MQLTIAFITGRQEPRLDWVLDDLGLMQQPGDQLDLIIIDALGRIHLETFVPGFADRTVFTRYPFLRSVTLREPKPTPWQGRYRVTKQDWWAKSNAANTAFALCETEWIAFLDDRCKLGMSWLAAVRRAMTSDVPYVVCGGYEKRHDLGNEVGGTRVAIDNRYEATGGKPNVGCGGQWLYGCTFALPLPWALAVNGFEEGCDGQSAEDYIFGMNLANAGYPLTYDPDMWVIQDRSPGQENAYRREDKGVSPKDKSHAALSRFGSRKRTEFTADLGELRRYFTEHGTFPALVAPEGGFRDWYDGQPLSEM